MDWSKFPHRGQVYTLLEIEKELELRDSPALGFEHNGKTEYVQTAHLTSDELLARPGWAETRWRFIRETHEWIPLFQFVGESLLHLVTKDNGDHYHTDELFIPL